ncbi:Gfo/Idh/MocA family protein [Lysinibacillus fusiformis]|uniref:Gfo/Idh/MocA family protein n=1 Tax=Lysinibacillus fusiformis TaxID=28031 RepID=UPI0037F7EA62
MKALVIGFGSIGQRHARILKEMGLDVYIVSRRLNDNQVSYSNVSEALLENNFEYIVIANETVAHLYTLHQIIDMDFRGIVLVEKPLFLNYEKLNSMPSKIFVAYNLRFNPLLEAVKKLLIGEVVISVNAYVGQYLPTWRPNTDYSKGYSASSELGGGVLRDLSHELDYLTLLFGEWQCLVSNKEKISSLAIQSEDYVQLSYKTDKQIYVAVELNYLDRIMQRYMTIQTNTKTIKVDFIHNSINCNGVITQFEMLDRDYTYKKQHENVLSGGSTCCTFAEGLKLMQMIEAVETSSQQRKWVYND